MIIWGSLKQMRNTVSPLIWYIKLTIVEKEGLVMSLSVRWLSLCDSVLTISFIITTPQCHIAASLRRLCLVWGDKEAKLFFKKSHILQLGSTKSIPTNLNTSSDALVSCEGISGLYLGAWCYSEAQHIPALHAEIPLTPPPRSLLVFMSTGYCCPACTRLSPGLTCCLGPKYNIINNREEEMGESNGMLS